MLKTFVITYTLGLSYGIMLAEGDKCQVVKHLSQITLKWVPDYPPLKLMVHLASCPDFKIGEASDTARDS